MLCRRGHQRNRSRRFAVTPRAPAFLKKRFDARRKIRMDHAADIRLVQAHSVGAGGCEHAVLRVEEPPLGLLFDGSLKPGVVRPNGVGSQHGEQRVAVASRVGARSAEHDRRPLNESVGEQTAQRARDVECRHHVVAQVGAVGVAAHNLDLLVAEQERANIGEYRVRRGRGERANRSRLDGGDRPSDLTIRGAKRRTPLADAVGLVNHEVCRRGLREQRRCPSYGQHLRVCENEIDRAGSDKHAHPSSFFGRHPAADLDCAETGRAEATLLVVHQAEQRVDDHRRPVEEELR